MPAKRSNKQTVKPVVRPLIVTIRASEWARGDYMHKHKQNRLLNNDGTKCCLGFDGLACGLEEEQLRDQAYPGDVSARQSVYRDVWTENGRQYDAAAINDSTSITDDKRIAKLRPIFARLHPPRIIRWLPNR